MKCLCSLVIFMASLPIFSLAQSLTWDCPQSNPSTRPLPESASIAAPMSIQGKAAVINKSAFLEFVDRAVKSSSNYRYCLRRLNNQFQIMGRDYCQEKVKDAQALKTCLQQVDSTYAEVEKKAEAIKLDSTPLTIAGESMQNGPSPSDLKYGKQSCFLFEGLQSAEFVKSGLKEFLGGLDPECRSKATESAIQSLSATLEYACQNPKSDYCQRLQRSSPALVQLLNQSQDRPLKDLCLAPEKIISDLRRLADSLGQYNRCLPLKKGEPRIIDSTAIAGLNGAGYAITALENKKFRLDLKIDFLSTGNGFESKTKDEFTAELKRCIEIVNTKLKGPHGEKLELFVNAADAPKKLNATTVEISKDVARENSQRWSPYSSCPVQTHEMMHLLGLSDDYTEDSSGYLVNPVTGRAISQNLPDKPPVIPAGAEFRTEYDCRSPGAPHSIMNRQTYAMNRAFGGSKEYSTCTCDSIGKPTACAELSKVKALQKQTAALSANALNDPKSISGTFYDLCYGEGLSYKNYSELGPDMPMPKDTPTQVSVLRSKYPTNQPQTESLLLPKQFQQIISPGCKEKLGLFYVCNQDHQKSSFLEGCKTKPKECKDWTKWQR